MTTTERPEIGAGSLRQVLDFHRHAEGLTLDDLTVLSSGRDPFRLDTPANHRGAEKEKLRQRLAEIDAELKRGTAVKPDYKAIRAWAAANGIEVKPSGLLPKSVLQSYAEAHDGGAA